ncbi:MAG: tetratricopeptide repeat protein [Candidatus Omnitrophica bacterium]|nr:tetratricopeptide repeat protein [Candidatus Omnitrophota bacterium]
MKKILVVCFLVLTGLFVALTVLDKSEYGIEKRFWSLQKRFEKIAEDPKAVPERSYADLVRQYRRLIKKAPESPLGPKIYLQIAKIYSLREEHAKVRDVFEEILKNYAENDVLCSVTLRNIGMTYEKEGVMEQALGVYQRVLDEYPLTEAGLGMPLYIVDYYKRSQKADKLVEALRVAETRYKNVADAMPGTQFGIEALRHLSTVYLYRQDWRSVVDVLGQILVQYAGSGQLSPADAKNKVVRFINAVSVQQIKDPSVAIGIYEKFIVQNPKHPLNDFLQNTIDSLKGSQNNE